MVAMSTSSIRIDPSNNSTIRKSTADNDDFPAPVLRKFLKNS